MTKDEALRLALEALKSIDEAMPFPVAKLAIKECKAALEAKDEPDYKELWQQMCERCDSLDKKLAQQDAMLERQTARIVDLQTHIENFDGEDR